MTHLGYQCDEGCWWACTQPERRPEPDKTFYWVGCPGCELAHQAAHHGQTALERVATCPPPDGILGFRDDLSSHPARVSRELSR